MTKCPKCNSTAPNADTERCPNCGASIDATNTPVYVPEPLPAPAPPAVVAAAESAPTPPAADCFFDKRQPAGVARSISTDEKSDRQAEATKLTCAPLVSAPDPELEKATHRKSFRHVLGRFFDAKDNECSDFSILCNVGSVFVEGLTVPIHFKVIPLTGDVLDPILYVRSQSHKIPPKHETIEEYLVVDKVYDYSIDMFIPKDKDCVGKHTMHVYLAYRKGRETHCFRQVLTQGGHVFGMHESACEVLNLTINQTMQGNDTGNANDTQKIQRVEGLNQIRESARGRSAYDALNGIIMEPVWEELILNRCRLPAELEALLHHCPRFEPPPPKREEANHPRVTLFVGDQPLHLQAQAASCEINLGRNRTCQICARVFNGKGHEDKQAGKSISGIHATFSCTPGQVRLLYGKPSDPMTYRMAFNDLQVRKNDPVVLPWNEPCRLLIAGETEDNALLAYEVTAWTVGKVRQECPLLPLPHNVPDQALAALFIRKLSWGESFLYVWHGCTLAPLGLPARAGGVVCDDTHKSFALRHEDEWAWLHPGAKLPGIKGWRVAELTLLRPPNAKSQVES